MESINLTCFKPCPAKLVLEGHQVFSDVDYKQLANYTDFSVCEVDPKTGRKMALSTEAPANYTSSSEDIYEQIKVFFANTKILYQLMERAINGRYNDFLHTRKDADLENAVKKCRTVNFKFTEDYAGFNLGSHMENLDTIAWSQIYLGPTNRISGTNFIGLPGVETPEYKIPFIANHGYFAINSMYTWHNVDVKVDNRRTLEIIWLS